MYFHELYLYVLFWNLHFFHHVYEIHFQVQSYSSHFHCQIAFRCRLHPSVLIHYLVEMWVVSVFWCCKRRCEEHSLTRAGVWSIRTPGLEWLLPGRGISSKIMSDYFQSSCVSRSAYSRSDFRRKLMMSLHTFAILKMTSLLRGCRSVLDIYKSLEP